jgi:CxxC-x17-CxxC domain-containing protein
MKKGINVFAETTFRNKFRKFGIKTDDRRRHMYLIGKTGMGKSTILENMIIDDIRSGHGVAVVDPHGDLAEKVIKYIPNSRINDVIYFNPADYEYPIAFNVLEQVEPHLRHLVASGLIGVFQKLWADSWGPRLEYILRNTILAILDYPGSTLLAVTRMLSDKKFRKKVIEKIEDPVVKAFWVNEFAGYADKFASEAVSPIQNKVGQFLSTSLIRNIVGQVKSTIHMREIMDTGKILILNLSKGRNGEDSSALLGAMMITKIQLAAMSRVDIPESDRKDFYLYIDEFQNFTTDSFANILSEARKYKLNLILAHQYIEQLGEVVRHAVFGNVGTLVVFRVGAADAEMLEPEFTPTFLIEDILNLPKYEFYLKLMIDGIASEPFSARGLPPFSKSEETNNLDKIIAVSRERYAKDKATVEEKISRWHNSDDEAPAPKPAITKPAPAPSPASVPPKPAYKDTTPKTALGEATRTSMPAPSIPPSSQPREIPRPEERAVAAKEAPQSAPNPLIHRHSAICTRCNAETKLSFKPDGVRPVYCKDCLFAIREEKKQELVLRKRAKESELAKFRDKVLMSPKMAKQTAVAKVDDRKNFLKKEDLTTPRTELSLSEALEMRPVNFKGKEIEEKNRQSEDVEDTGSAPVFYKKTAKNDLSKNDQSINKPELEKKSIKKINSEAYEADEFDIEPDRSIDF